MSRKRLGNLPEIAIALAIAATCITCAHAAERAETATLIRQIAPPIEVIEERPPTAKDTITFDSYYETSDILQGSRYGHWSELTNLFGYTHGNIHGYMFVSEYERFDDRDFTGNFGAYINSPGEYAHIETAFGWKVTYMYKFQTIAEYGHRAYKTLYWQLGYSYRAYGTDDVHMVYPGLVYYFGDSYIAGNCGVSMTEGRGGAPFGSVKGNFFITKFLQWWGGMAIGQRLYDIFELESSKETGYELFTGLTYNLYKGINLRAGYSYARENPKFIKRSLNFGASVKF